MKRAFTIISALHGSALTIAVMARRRVDNEMPNSSSVTSELSSDVLTRVDGQLFVITLNRPQARNAVTSDVSRTIARLVDEFEARDDLCVAIVTGAGGTFCSGMDLKSFAAGRGPASIPIRGFAGLTESPPTKPLIAAVEGWALAGGFELALTADIVVASRTAMFGLPEVKRGLIASGGGLLRLPKTIPYAVAMRIALTGEPLDAVEAAHFGIVSQLVDEGSALTAAIDLGRKIAANGPLAVRATKQILASASNWTDHDAFERQHMTRASIMESADAREGALAFSERRAPVWSGR